MIINAESKSFRELNEEVRSCTENEITIEGCMGQRYIGTGLSGKSLRIKGVPGNAMGAYLDGASIIVDGNVQDSVGDTMNDGLICVYGSSGDAAGYAMRGGAIYVRDNVGYRAGVHMKSYMSRNPVIVIGGCAGSFLGEYQAGGQILVLNLNEEKLPAGNFCGTGMYGGKIYIRGENMPEGLSGRIRVSEASEDDMEIIRELVEKYCDFFGSSPEEILNAVFHKLEPDEKNPYRQIYVAE